MTHLVHKVVASHFQAWNPVQIGPDLYRLRLRNGDCPTLGSSDDMMVDIPVTICTTWEPFKVIPGERRISKEKHVNLAPVISDFLSREHIWKPGTFILASHRRRAGEPPSGYHFNRRQGTPDKVSKHALINSSANASEWGKLIEGKPNEVLRFPLKDSYDWTISLQKSLAIEDVDYYLDLIRQSNPQLSYGLPAYEALATLGMMQKDERPGWDSYAHYLASDTWQAHRERTLERDGGKCVFCGAPGVDIHHVVYPKHLGEEDPRTLLTVCKKCHGILHGAMNLS